MTRRTLSATALSIVLASAIAHAQSPSFTACREPGADALATLPGGSLLSMPGVATDFVLAAGGQLSERGDGTAHLSAFVYRASEIDRQFLIEVELSGRVLPGAANHPPTVTLSHELLPTAYVPTGPIDPATFRFYAIGSGSLRGYGAYAGALVSLQMSAPLQIGVGANNRNGLNGMACSFTVQVQTQPTFLTLNPTDEARFAANALPQLLQCVSHVDRDDGISTGPARAALVLPGVGVDYVFIPAGGFTEASNGTATLTGTMRREDDFDDRWDLTLALSTRVDPGDGAYPPTEGPVLGLNSSAYLAAGGTVDPDTFRYYRTVTGTLIGAGSNAGGQIALTSTRPAQVGIGANQGNRFLGFYAELAANLLTNPTSHALTITGASTLRADIATACVLPYPNQTPGLHIVLDNISGAPGFITGANLAWIEQMSIGSRTITTGNPRNWTAGSLKVISTSLVEVRPPQNMAPGTYTTRVYTRSAAGGLRQMTLNVPSAPTMRTNDDRFTGEAQDLYASQGNFPTPAIGAIFYSGSNLPSPIPGIGNFSIGNGLSDFTLLSIVLPDPVTKAGLLHFPAVPASIQGARIYFQAAFVDGATLAFPAAVSDVWSTLYL